MRRSNSAVKIAAGSSRPAVRRPQEFAIDVANPSPSGDVRRPYFSARQTDIVMAQMTAHTLVPFLSSIAIGLLIGLERERSHPTDAHQTAGSRTFALLALSGTLAASFNAWLVVTGFAATAALLTGVLTAALLLGRWIVDVAGARATLLATGAAGLADAHAGALTAATLHRQGQVGTSIALLGIAAAICANTGVKCVLAFVAGGRRFGWRVVAGLVPATLAFLTATVIAATSV